LARVRAGALVAIAAGALALHLYCRVEWRWFALGWIFLVPWLAVLDRAASPSAVLLASLAMCAAFVLGAFGWFAESVSVYTGLSPCVALALLVVAAPLLQPQLVVFACVRRLVRARAGIAYATATAALAYVGAEWMFPKLFGDTIGHGFYASPLMRQAADLGGAPGLTFVLVVANECANAALARARERAPMRRVLAPIACVACMVAALAAYGALRYGQLARDGVAGHAGASLAPDRREPAVAAPLIAGLVQADIAGYDRLRAEKGTYETVRMILDAHFALSRQALRRAHSAVGRDLDLLVWPETVYPTTLGSPKSEDGAAFDREIAGFVTRTGVPLVLGAYDADAAGEYNAAFFLHAGAGAPVAYDIYRKARPFPLTEHVPSLLDTAAIRKRLAWLGAWQPGPGARVVDLQLADGRRLPVAPLICLDAVDPQIAIDDVRKGAQVILTLSNDSWFTAGEGPHLHLVVSAFRSLETRRPQLRATNTGISAVFTPTGEMVASAGVHERTALVAEVVPVTGERTLMLAWGDWFGPAAAAAAALLTALALVRGRPT
jgi:apolipoprotein N-acyltransferase